MSKRLLIVFVKNSRPGSVKTRLAKTIGYEAAFTIYKELVAITENAIQHIAVDKIIYFSETLENTSWNTFSKKVQLGTHLGERMQHAFQEGFQQGYTEIVLIGSDLPDISETIIQSGFNALKNTPLVFGPAQDGGYYLIGMTQPHSFVFTNKPWSQPNLLQETLIELKEKNIGYTLLETLNDIDTFEDLQQSNFYNNSKHIQEIVKAVIS